MKAGAVGPLTAALMAHLEKVAAGEVEAPTYAQLGEMLGTSPATVQEAVRRLRLRRCKLAAHVKDMRLHNGGRRYKPVLTTVQIALRTRTPLERVWRNSNLGALDPLGESTP